MLTVGGDVLPATHDYITTGGLIVGALITTVGGVLVALINRNTNISRAALEAASKASRQTEKTGNGYAGRTEAKLEFIVNEVNLIRGQQAAASDERREIRSDVRSVSRRVDRIDARLEDHLEGKGP